MFVVMALAVFVGWQIGGVYVENYEFSGDLKDLAAQNNARTGLEPIATEAELKSAVMQAHGSMEFNWLPITWRCIEY